MSVDLIKQFMKEKEKLNDEQYFITTLAYHLAPVMKCNKPSSILTFSKRNRGIYDLWDRFKYKLIMDTAISFYELKRTEDNITVLFFIPCCLLNVIQCDKNRIFFLKKHGYEEYPSIHGYLEKLKKRYEKECPHEIGLFLGVPLKDVESFISHHGKNYLICGYWKVYHKLQQNIKIFSDYDKAKNSIVKLVTSGQYNDILAS